MKLLPHRGRLVLAFQQINPINVWLIWLCSKFVPVLIGKDWNVGLSDRFVLKIPKWCLNHSLISKVTHNQKMAFYQIGWRFYRRRFKGSEKQSLFYKSAGLELDYAPLLLKALANELHVPVFLRWMAKRLGLPRPIYLGAMIWPSSLQKENNSWTWFRVLHAGFLWCKEIYVALLLLGVQLYRLAVALSSRKLKKPDVNVLWFGISTNEYGEFGVKRCFYWPTKASSNLKVFYILDRAPNQKFREVLKREGVVWATKFDILRFCSKGQLFDLLLRLVISSFRMILPWKGSWLLQARLSGLHFEALTWDQFSKAVYVKAAFTTDSAVSSTLPNLVALQKREVKTALWFYSAHMILFTHPGGKNYFNGILSTVHEAQRVYVWNRHIGSWNEENFCYNKRNEIVPVGPLMCGDANLCAEISENRDERFSVSVFDVNRPAGKLKEVLGDYYLSDEFYEVFWTDMGRLLNDFPEMKLVLKPKRSTENRNCAFPDSFFRLFNDENLQQKDKLEILSDDADPYLAVKKCQVAVSMPFTSPTLAAWHFGRVGIFYDPVGIVENHKFQKMGRFFCRSYESLKMLVREAMENRRRGNPVVLPEGISEFIGPVFRGNPQELFLRDVSAWALSSESNRKADLDLNQRQMRVREV